MLNKPNQSIITTSPFSIYPIYTTSPLTYSYCMSHASLISPYNQHLFRTYREGHCVRPATAAPRMAACAASARPVRVDDYHRPNTGLYGANAVCVHLPAAQGRAQ